jgi:hypothetical protein
MNYVTEFNLCLTETPAKKKKTKKRKRDNDYDVDKSSKSIISVDVGLTDSDGRRNTFFNLKKDFTNKGKFLHIVFFFISHFFFFFCRFFSALFATLSNRGEEWAFVFFEPSDS